MTYNTELPILHALKREFLSNSDALSKAKKLAQRLAISAEHILLEGGSGTDKELFPQEIHNQSRSNRPFIALNCAAFPRNLVESELFGYERGTFTDAEKNGRPGKIELANGGTLFLDEIGDMPIEIQLVLLRVLEDRQVMRLGGKTCYLVDFRLVIATNKDFYAMSQKKLFREDFYFHLSVIRIVAPPLRERCEDIILLADYFVQRYSRRMNVKPPKISHAVQSKLLAYQWIRNVRQLENIIIYEVNMAQGNLILPEHLLLESVKPGKTSIVDDEKNEDDLSTVISLKESEKLMIQSIFKKHAEIFP